MVKEANQWIQNNIGRHGQKDQFKGKSVDEATFNFIDFVYVSFTVWSGLKREAYPLI